MRREFGYTEDEALDLAPAKWANLVEQTRLFKDMETAITLSRLRMAIWASREDYAEFISNLFGTKTTRLESAKPVSKPGIAHVESDEW